MKAKVSGELIRQQGRALRNIDVPKQRAGELAVEVERLNRAILDAARALDFNDEPAAFLSALGELQVAGRARTRAKRGRK